MLQNSRKVLVIILSRISDNNPRHRAVEVQSPYGFWKVMEIENAIFQQLESFSKGRIFCIGYGNVFDISCENPNHILKWMKFSFLLSTVYVMCVHFTIYNTEHNPPNNYKIYQQK